MKKILFVVFALFAIALAQEGGEEPQPTPEPKPDDCSADIERITTDRGTCLAGKPQSCGCFNESSDFYRERPECIIDPYVDGTAFNTYARMCNAYKCEGCVGGAFSFVPAVIAMFAIIALLF